MSEDDLTWRLTEALTDDGGLNAEVAAACAELVAPIVKAYARLEVRRFYLDAADEAMVRGRRGPNAVAGWLLDFGRAWVDQTQAQP